MAKSMSRRVEMANDIGKKNQEDHFSNPTSHTYFWETGEAGTC